MAGLLGMGGMNGFSPDMGLQSLLGDAYDPAALRNMQLKRGLLGAGAAMLSQGPSQYPVGFGQMLGQGLGAGLNAAGQAQDDYMQQAKTAFDVKRMGINDEWSQREQARKEKEWAEADKRKAAFDEMIGGLPQDQRGFAQAYPDQYAKQRAAQLFPDTSGGGAEYGLNPIWLQNPQTNEYMVVQPSKDGSAPKQMQFPQGYLPAPQTRTVDTGTGYVTMPTRGNGMPIGGVVPKDLAGAEYQKKVGADQGDNVVLLKSMRAKLPGLEQVVSQLDALAEKATYTIGGQLLNEVSKQTGFGATEGAVARTKYKSTVANQVLPLLRDTFGAQFTAAEGERLLATLGDPDVTPAEKQATLHAFIDQKKRDIEGLAIQTGEQPSPQAQPVPQPNSGGTTKSGITWGVKK